MILDYDLNEARRQALSGRSNVGPVGLRWAEKAPPGWTVTTLQRLFVVSSGDFLPPGDLQDEGYPVFGGNGFRGYFRDTNCHSNTMLIGRYGALCGNVHIPSVSFWATEHAFRVRPLVRYHQPFVARYVEALELRHLAARAAQPGLNSRMVREQAIALPDLATQRQIADFLDRETARIDLLIEKKLRLVALLGEKLEDDILRATTLGIDPDAELVSENDLEWTSHRPKHWKLFRLKHFFRENTHYSSDGLETLFSLRMKEGLVPHNDVSDKEIPPRDLINYKKVFPGQIVMNRMRASIGLFGLADSAGIVSPDYSIFDVSPLVCAAFFLRLFKTEPMMAAFRLLSKGLGDGRSGFMRLNADNFGRIRVAVPSREEQELISEYVEKRIWQIIRLQTNNDQSIDRLREYRSALITAAVTGQIDVAKHSKSGTADRRLDAIQEEMGA